MKCPLCEIEMRITASRNIIKMEDDVPHLFTEQDLSCLNEKCENYNTVVETVSNEQPVG